MKKVKNICIIVLVLCFLIVSANINTFAATTPSDPSEAETFKDFFRVNGNGKYSPITESTFIQARTAWQYKTKYVYSSNGKTVAKVTLQYSTYIYGGRPQFDEVGIEINFYNDYRGSYEYDTVSPDLISVNIRYNLYGILQGSELLLFNP